MPPFVQKLVDQADIIAETDERFLSGFLACFSNEEIKSLLLLAEYKKQLVEKETSIANRIKLTPHLLRTIVLAEQKRQAELAEQKDQAALAEQKQAQLLLCQQASAIKPSTAGDLAVPLLRNAKEMSDQLCIQLAQETIARLGKKFVRKKRAKAYMQIILAVSQGNLDRL